MHKIIIEIVHRSECFRYQPWRCCSLESDTIPMISQWLWESVRCLAIEIGQSLRGIGRSGSAWQVKCRTSLARWNMKRKIRNISRGLREKFLFITFYAFSCSTCCRLASLSRGTFHRVPFINFVGVFTCFRVWTFAFSEGRTAIFFLNVRAALDSAGTDVSIAIRTACSCAWTLIFNAAVDCRDTKTKFSFFCFSPVDRSIFMAFLCWSWGTKRLHLCSEAVAAGKYLRCRMRTSKKSF